MALTADVVRIAEQEAGRHGATRVTLVRLEMGALAAVDAHAVTFCFEAMVADNPLLAGAKLDIIDVPAEAQCPGCGRIVPIAQRFDPCPHCAAFGLKVVKGETMRVLELEVA